jgi:HK97 gp10 family phage protein
MAGPVTVKFEGGRELQAALDAFADEFDASKTVVRNVMNRALVDAAQPMVERARQLAPNDPETPAPDLSTSITAGPSLYPRQRRLQRREGRSFAEVFVGLTGHAIRYAHLMEFGTAHSSPRPFMRPALDSEGDTFLSLMRGALTKQLDRATQRARKKAMKKAAR